MPTRESEHRRKMRGVAAASLASVLALLGCAASTPSTSSTPSTPSIASGSMSSPVVSAAPSTDVPSTAPTSPLASHEPHGQLIGHSVSGAPIAMHRFGKGSPSVLILGGIHGDETAAVELAQRLLDHLARNPQACVGRSVFVISVANPDGVAARRRVNANGVDLNRNFPAANFKASRRYGVTAASQPETRALLSAVDQVRPALIISIHCIDRERQCNNYDGPAEAIANLMSRHNGYPAAPTIGYPTPGSLGSYAGIDRSIGVITLELPRTALSEPVWNANRNAIVAAIGATE